VAETAALLTFYTSKPLNNNHSSVFAEPSKDVEYYKHGMGRDNVLLGQ
jgi:hypothetical protein